MSEKSKGSENRHTPSPSTLFSQFCSLQRRVDDSLRWPSTRGEAEDHAKRLRTFLSTHRSVLSETRAGRSVIVDMEKAIKSLDARLRAAARDGVAQDVVSRAKDLADRAQAFRAAGSAAEADKHVVRLHVLVPELEDARRHVHSDAERKVIDDLIGVATQHSDKATPSSRRKPDYDPAITPRLKGTAPVAGLPSPRKNSDAFPSSSAGSSSMRSKVSPTRPMGGGVTRPSPLSGDPTSSSSLDDSRIATDANQRGGDDQNETEQKPRSVPHDSTGRPIIRGLEQRRPSTIIAPALLRRRDSLAILMDNRPSLDVLKDRNVIREQPMGKRLAGVKKGLDLKLAVRPDKKELEDRGILVAAKELMKRRTQRRDSLAMLLDKRPSFADLQKRNIIREKTNNPSGRSTQAPKPSRFSRPSSSAGDYDDDDNENGNAGSRNAGGASSAMSSAAAASSSSSSSSSSEGSELTVSTGSGGGLKKSPSHSLLSALGQKTINSKLSEGGSGNIKMEVTADVAQQLDPRHAAVDMAYPEISSMKKSTSSMSISSDHSAVGPSYIKTHPANMKHSVEVGGFSVVAYHDANAAVQGAPKFTATHDGRTYHFRNEAEIMVFQEDPDAYVPEFLGRACAFTLASSGNVVHPDPQTFKVIKGRTYLFANDGEFDGRQRWEDEIASGDVMEEELIERGHDAWKGLQVTANEDDNTQDESKSGNQVTL